MSDDLKRALQHSGFGVVRHAGIHPKCCGAAVQCTNCRWVGTDQETNMGMFPAYPGWCPKCQGPTFVRFDLQLLSWAWFDKRRRRILPDVTFTMDVRAGIAAGMFTVERED